MDWKAIPQRLWDEGQVRAFICGGAARDTILGGEIRDIDVYISHEKFAKAREVLTGKHVDAWDDMCSEFPESLAVTMQQGDEEYDHQYIWVQEELTIPEYSHPINLIGVHEDAYDRLADGFSAESIVSLFNLTTSQAWFDREGTVRSTFAFDVSQLNKCVNITREDWGQEGTKRCVIKFLQKYPEWRVSVPDIDVVYSPQAEAALDAWITGSML